MLSLDGCGSPKFSVPLHRETKLRWIKRFCTKIRLSTCAHFWQSSRI